MSASQQVQTVKDSWTAAAAANADTFFAAVQAAVQETERCSDQAKQQLIKAIPKLLAAGLARGLSLLVETPATNAADALLCSTTQVLVLMHYFLSGLGLKEDECGAFCNSMQSCAELQEVMPTAAQHFNTLLPQLVAQAQAQIVGCNSRRSAAAQPTASGASSGTTEQKALRPHEQLCLTTQLASEILRLWLLFEVVPNTHNENKLQHSPQQQARASKALHAVAALHATLLRHTQQLQAVAAACSTGLLQSPGLVAYNSNFVACIQQGIQVVVSYLCPLVECLRHEVMVIEKSGATSQIAEVLAAVPDMSYLVAVDLALIAWFQHNSLHHQHACSQQANSSSPRSSNTSSSSRESSSKASRRKGQTGSSTATAGGRRQGAGGSSSRQSDRAAASADSSSGCVGPNSDVDIPAYHADFLSSCGLGSATLSCLEDSHQSRHLRNADVKAVLYLVRLVLQSGGFAAPRSSSSVGSGRLDGRQWWLFSACIAELCACAPSPSVLALGSALLLELGASGGRALIPLAARLPVGSGSAAPTGSAGAAAAGPAGSHDSSLLSLAMQLMLPAMQRVAEAHGPTAQSPADSNALVALNWAHRSLHMLIRCAVLADPKDVTDATFESSTFKQQPMATLAAIEAAIRFDNTASASARASGSRQRPDARVGRDKAAQRVLGYMRTDLGREGSTLSAFAAAGPSEAAAVLSLLLSCLKFCSAQLAGVQPLAADDAEASPCEVQPEVGGFRAVVGGGGDGFASACNAFHAALRLFDIIAARDGTVPGMAAAAAEASTRQRLLSSCIALAGRALHVAARAWHVALAAATAFVASGVFQQLLSSMPWIQGRPSELSACDRATMLLAVTVVAMQRVGADERVLEQADQHAGWFDSSALDSVLQLLPASSHPGWSLEQLRELHEAFADTCSAALTAAGALMTGRPLSPEAEEASKQGQGLAADGLRLGAALCAAFPSKLCCNDPGCDVLDKASEQLLVKGGGRTCSGCKTARYCCREHQLRHWPDHKAACKALGKAARRAVAGAAEGLNAATAE